MGVRIKTEISANDFARLRKAEAIIKMLYKLEDSAWISEEVEDFTRRYSVYWLDLIGDEHEATTITKAVPPFVLPVSKSFVEFFQPNTPSNCTKIYSGAATFSMKPDIRVTLPGFTVGPTGILLNIAQGEVKEQFVFGPFFNKKDQAGCPTQKNIIYNLVKTFYPRQALYTAIYAQLVAAKKEFSEAFGEKFIAALTLLFSASQGAKKLPNFDFFTKKFGTTLFCQRVVRKDLEWSGNIYPIDYGEGKEFCWQMGRDMEFWLRMEAEKPYIVAWYYGATPPFTEGLADKYAFIDLRLNNAMQQMEAFAAFGREIYEQVRNRILFENI